MSTLLLERVRLNLLLTITYGVLGSLALRIAIEPGITSPIFPPAGIALAAVLLYGPSVLPGVFAGSLAVQTIAAFTTGIDLEPALLLGIPLGNSLQALAGCWLAQRLRVFPSALDEAKPVALLICVVAPLSCLFSASIASLLFSQLPATAGMADLFNWTNWWAGDVLGILTITPICVALLARPAARWDGRRSQIAIPLLIATLVLATALMLVRQREETRVNTEFLRNAENVAHDLQAKLQAKSDVMLALERHVSLNPELTPAIWQHLTRAWLNRNPSIINLTWNPRVTRASRKRFEAEQIKLHPSFSIRDRNPAGQLLPASDADEYYPITLLEPLAGNEKVLGLNPMGYALGRDPITASRKTGQLVASNPIPLVQGPDKQTGVILYQTVFSQDATIGAPPYGVLSAALKITDIINFASRQIESTHVQLCLTDRSAPEGAQHMAGPVDCENDSPAGHALTFTHPVEFADRNWEIMLYSETGYASASRGWASGAALGTSLIFSGMLCAFLLLTTGRARRTAELVSQRTAELAQASARLRDQQALLAHAQRIARMGSWELNLSGNTLLCSEEFLRLLELPPETRISRNTLLSSLITEDRSRLDAAFDAASQNPDSQTLDCRIQDCEGVEQILHFHVESEWFMGRLMRVFGTAQNVTSARQAEAHIQHLARFDALTDLPNRSYWLEQARAALLGAQRHNDQAAVLFLDLDHFKTINDSLGHQVGDQLLSAVAQRLRLCLRAEDILARQGGDEFVLLLPRLRGIEEITTVASKLVKSLSAPIPIDGHELSVSVSIGIAHFPSDAEDIDTLLKHADLAMYGAKQAGRNNYQFFVPEMNQRAMQRLQLESALRRAIERHELVLHYQPQQELASGHIEGCEALVRWQHPELGMVPPIDFIPLAEESGLILPLGEWVMREACAQQVRWAAEGLPLIMAINIAALQFQQTDFVSKVRNILKETGANPRMIELEITEGALLASTDELVERLEQIRSMGVGLALDDFGTGYSCLAYLKRLPIERLKIDRSFIKDLPGDAEDAAIASATLSMARDLGMKVVAEGVENEAQRAYLIERRCSSIQGYFVCKPKSADELSDWLRQQQQKA